MDVIENKYEPNGYRIEIYHDPDVSNPRDDNPETEFPFLGFPHRSYKIGDEAWDPRHDQIECGDCHGSGELENEDSGNAIIDCERCYGRGFLTYSDDGVSLTDVIEAKAKDMGAILWRKVGMIDHSSVHYYLGDGPHAFDPQGWDSGTCGVMFVTHDVVNHRWGPLPGSYAVAPGDPGWETSPNNEEFLIECMRGDLQLYDDWANGYAYGFTVYDRNGDEIDSCGGYLGDWETSGLLDQARACIPDEPPALLYTVRLTEFEISDILSRTCDSDPWYHKMKEAIR